MSMADATAALEGAISADNGGTPAPAPTPAPEQASVAPSTPEGQQAPQVQPHWSQQQPREQGRFAGPPEQQTPLEPQVQPEAQPDTFDGGQFNPDTLPPELQPGWKQLQAAYTRKTQELALQRQQLEGIDPAVAREAVELYTALQDPQYLQQFHQELTVALQAQGLTHAQASTQAAQQIQEATSPAPQAQSSAADQLAALKADPELAPVADLVTQLQSRLDTFEQQQAQAREAQEMQQLQMAMAGELVRQESVLRESGFNQADIDRIHELSPWHDGNLLKAAESYTAQRQAIIEEYLGGKQAVTPGVGPVPSTQISNAPTEITDLNDALKAGLAQLQQAGITELM